MTILSAAAENFLPFRRRVELPVADLGLVRVLGENRVSGAADSNGCGKSALLSVLAYGLYGTTLCGRSADDVVNRFGRGPTTVEVVLSVAGATWRVTRRRRPSGVFLHERAGDGWVPRFEDGGEREVTAWVESHYQPWRVFRNAVVFDRFERFARQDQAEQLRMLDAVQGVDFRTALDRAKAWRVAATEAVATARARASSAETSIEEARVAVAELERIRDAFRADARTRVITAEAGVTRAEADVAAAKQKAAACRDAVGRVVAAGAVVEQLDKLLEARRRADDDAAVATRAATTAADAERALAAKVDALVAAGRCAACRRPVARAADVAAGFDADGAAAREASARAEGRRVVAARRADAAAKALDAYLAGRDPAALRADLARLEAVADPRVAAEVREAVTAAEARLTAAVDAVAAARATRWSGADALRAAMARVRELSAAIVEARGEADRRDRDAAVAAYCVELFGDRGVRSLLVDAVAGFLMERTAAHLDAIAAGEARLTVAATTTLKGGGARERLSVVPDWAWGGVGKRAESEGQDGRTDLALFAAIQDLAEAASARPFGLKVLDEPGTGLDARGVELFGAWIMAEARRRGTTFLVTHSRELADAVDPDETWTVVLDGPGDARLDRGRPEFTR